MAVDHWHEASLAFPPPWQYVLTDSRVCAWVRCSMYHPGNPDPVAPAAATETRRKNIRVQWC